MPELRWALLGLGALFVVVLAIWEWRRSRRRHAQAEPEVAVASVAASPADEWPRRIEPRIDSLLGTRGGQALPVTPVISDVPVIHPADPLLAARGATPETAGARLSVRVAPETAVDVPTASIRWPPARADRVLTLRVVNASGAPLAGRSVRLALENSGLVPGPQRIYHRVGADGAVLASAANMLRPGDLDPIAMDEQQFRGLSVFSVLPGPQPATRLLEELVELANTIAGRLGATVQDDRGQVFDGERLASLRQSLPGAAEGN